MNDLRDLKDLTINHVKPTRDEQKARLYGRCRVTAYVVIDDLVASLEELLRFSCALPKCVHPAEKLSTLVKLELSTLVYLRI